MLQPFCSILTTVGKRSVAPDICLMRVPNNLHWHFKHMTFFWRLFNSCPGEGNLIFLVFPGAGHLITTHGRGWGIWSLDSNPCYVSTWAHKSWRRQTLMNSKEKITNFSGLVENQRSTQALFRICFTVQLQQGDTKNTWIFLNFVNTAIKWF